MESVSVWGKFLFIDRNSEHSRFQYFFSVFLFSIDISHRKQIQLKPSWHILDLNYFIINGNTADST